MIAVALLALALYIPLTLYPPSDVSHAIFRVAVCLGIAGGVAIPRGRLVRWGLALWALGIVSSVILAPDPWRALWSTHNRNEGAWQVAHYFGLVLVAARAPRESLTRWLAVAATLSAMWGFLPLGWVNGRLAGSTGNPLYLAPLLLVGCWGAWRAGGAWRALLSVLSLAALATGSKGVVVALLAAGGVLLLAKGSRAAIVIAGVAAAVGLWFLPLGGSALIRLELGRVAGLGIVTAPWGWGAEGFPLVWDTFWRGVAPTGEAWHDRAHSLILDRAIEWGLVGAAGWLAVVVATWRRAELPERVAIAAYLGFGLTMFEMMWGAAGFAVLLGYVLRGTVVRPSCLPRNLAEVRDNLLRDAPPIRALGLTYALVALVVGSAQLAQSRALVVAPDDAALRAAIDHWSPVGGDVIELYLKRAQTAESLEWAEERVEWYSPHRTQQHFLLAAWDRRYCADLRLLAPTRPDVRVLCAEITP